MKPEFAEQRRKARRKRLVTIQCVYCDATGYEPIRQHKLDRLIAEGFWCDVVAHGLDCRNDLTLWADYQGKCRDCLNDLYGPGESSEIQRELF